MEHGSDDNSESKRARRRTSRRGFIGAVGATSALGLRGPLSVAASEAYYFQDSYAKPPYPGLQHRRISGIPLYNSGNANHPYGNANWQVYQPFVLHTTDEHPVATLGPGNNHAAHAVAFRTVDQTETTTSAAPTYGQRSYGGGKLGAYTIWDTGSYADGNAPIVGNYNAMASPAPEFEFYNYSPSRNSSNANPAELGNEFGSSVNYPASALAEPYLTDFLDTGNNNGVNVSAELYSLTANGSTSNYVQQVKAAIQTAFNNYAAFQPPYS